MKISSEFVHRMMHAQNPQELYPLLQAAIELEHATIPPYLCGYFTLKPNTNIEVGNIIRSVVIEEMLHMTHACNLLNAIGGHPSINGPHFVPKYPSELPMGIGDDFKIHLHKCTLDHVRDVFMKIETPEDPLPIPVAQRQFALLAKSQPMDQEFDTIGAYYTFLKHKLEEFSHKQDIFIGDPSLQVVANDWFPDPDEMFPITDLESAIRAIDLIIDQGEGTSTDPFVSDENSDGPKEPAHYYRFQEIVKGRKLIPAPGETPPYRFGGDPVKLETGDVYDMDENPRIEKYADGSPSKRMATQFSYSYTRLLNALHDTFNGAPDKLNDAMGIMYELRLLAHQVLQTPAQYANGAPANGKATGLSFEYQRLNK